MKSGSADDNVVAIGRPGSDLSAFVATKGAIQFIPKRTIRHLEMDRPDLVIRLCLTALIIVPVIVGILAVLAWRLYSVLAFTGAIELLLFGASLAAAASWLSAVAFTNYGIVRSDAGIDVYQDSLIGGRVAKYTVPWTELREILVSGRVGSRDVVITTGTLPLILDPGQARAVLGDPRFPLRSKIPPELASRLRT